MKRSAARHWIVGFLFVLISIYGYIAAQQTSAPQDKNQQPTVRIPAEAVLVDLVVRDKEGRTIRDLKAEEVEIFEDGDKREVISFAPIDRAAAGPGVKTKTDRPKLGRDAPTTPDPRRLINLVTLVFEGLGPGSRQLAKQAALDFLKEELQPNTYVAVFSIDQRLFVLQQFTDDTKLLRKAVEQATSGTFQQFVSQSEGIRKELERKISLEEAAEAAVQNLPTGPGQSPDLSGMSRIMRERELARITVSILSFSDTLQRDHQGRTSLFALLSLVREQRRLAGRKTLVYFSEGLNVPPNVVDSYRNLVSEANRANVSVYAVDARGLTAGGLMSSTRDMLNRTADVSRAQVSQQGSAVTREDVMVSESAEAALRTNTQGTLSDLAASTGGLLIANANDLREGMQQIVEDIGYYYELAYMPKSLAYDGKFRQISVKVSRPNVTVQSRSGYFAVPVSDASPSLPYETPLLTALASATLPKDFEYQSAALRFGLGAKGTQYSLVMEVPLASFTFQEDKQKKQYRTRFSLLAVVKDAQGQIIQKFSQDYPLQGPLEKLEALKKGNVIFLRHFYLPPGRHTVETAAYDHEQNKSSAQRSIIVVPESQPGVKMSNVVVVRRADPATAADQGTDNPFLYENLKIVPNLGEPVQKDPNAQLSLFLVLYTQPGVSEKPQLNVVFLRDGQVLARGTPPLPAADQEGHIPYVASVPLASFQPGKYEVLAVIQQGQAMAQERAFFSVSP